MGDRKPDIIEQVTRYNLWLVPHFPLDLPMRRPRSQRHAWREGLLDSIRKEGLRHPLLIYGHHPKGDFNVGRWGKYNEGRDPSMYIAFGTNRYWACEQLGWTTAPAIISLDKTKTPPWPDSKLIAPEEFKQYAPPGRVFVQNHAFGWKPYQMPEEEFG